MRHRSRQGLPYGGAFRADTRSSLRSRNWSVSVRGRTESCVRLRPETPLGGDESDRDVGNDMQHCTGNERVGLVSQPSCGELRGEERPQSYVEQQQGHVQYEEDGGLEEIAPSEDEAPHEHSAEQLTKQDLLTDGPKRDPDGCSC